MARLTSDDLTLEITYREACEDSLGHQTARYEVRFLWRGEPIIRDAVLKRVNSWWSSEKPGAFIASDFDAHLLLSTIEEALTTGEPRYHEPVDPDIVLAIYPDDFFPFLDAKWKIVWQSDEEKARTEERERRKREEGALPDDLFQVILAVDTYNLRGEHAYSGSGPALHMLVRRHELERFLADLRAEYTEARQRGEIDDAVEPDSERPEPNPADLALRFAALADQVAEAERAGSVVLDRKLGRLEVTSRELRAAAQHLARIKTQG
jgi:hypothetical protein